MMITAEQFHISPLHGTMRSLRFHGAEDLRLDQLEVPEPSSNEVRIRPLAVGLCGTDEHILHGEFPAAAPVALGHEIAGIVEAVGFGVASVKEGDLVTVQPNTYCGVCRYCRTGREHLCEKLRAYGVHLDGGFSQSMIARSSAVYRLPDKTDPRIGCLTEPLACCIHGIDRASIRSGASVLVIGAGLIGLLLTRLSRLAGAGLLTVSEPQAKRREKAIEFGADHVVDPQNRGEESALSATEGKGFDVVIDAVGSSSTFEQALRMSARGAMVLLFGVASPAAISEVRPFEVYARELTILGSFVNPYTHERAVSLLPQMQLEKLAIRTFALADFQDAFAAHKKSDDPAKIMILPQKERSTP